MNFAVMSGNTVVNVIVAESQEIAEDVTGAEVLQTDGVPWLGWTLHGAEWRPPMPTTGVWEWDAAAHAWVDVTPEPEPASEE